MNVPRRPGPPTDDYAIPAPLSHAALADLRKVADAAQWPRAVLLAAEIDRQQAIREAHEAQCVGDVAAESAAVLRRAEAAGRLEVTADELADAFLCLLALAIDRRPTEVFELMARAAAAVVKPVTAEVAQLRTDLEAVAEWVEVLRAEPAGVCP